jgi:hypothetical protein
MALIALAGASMNPGWINVPSISKKISFWVISHFLFPTHLKILKISIHLKNAHCAGTQQQPNSQHKEGQPDEQLTDALIPLFAAGSRSLARCFALGAAWASARS